jgi:hypothetical protein
MNFNQWANERAQRLGWIDMAFMKLAVAAFVLMLVQLVPALNAVSWEVYGLCFLIFAVRPVWVVLRKK